MRGVILTIFLTLLGWEAKADEKLTGQVIGVLACVDYTTNQQTATVNTPRDAFDGDLSTFFASWERSPMRSIQCRDNLWVRPWMDSDQGCIS